MKLKKMAINVLFVGVSALGVVNQASAWSMSDQFSAATGQSCPEYKDVHVGVTQVVSGKLSWRMDSSDDSYAKCQDQAYSLYPDHYSSEWGNASQACENGSQAQKNKVAEAKVEFEQKKQNFPDCNDISFTEEQGDHYKN